MSTREDIYSALWALVSAVPGFVTSSRTLQTWDALSPTSQMPALFLMQHKEDAIVVRGLPTVVKMHSEFYVYAATDKHSGVAASTVLNGLVDAITAALAPPPYDGEQTLTGRVSHCRIQGTIEMDEGVLGDVAMAIIPIEIVAVLTPAVATISVTPNPITVYTGIPLLLTIVPKDAAGIPLLNRTITITSQNAGIATVAQSGVVTAVSPGATTLTFVCEGVTAVVPVTAALAPVASVTVTPNPLSVLVGTPVQLTTVLCDVVGNILTGRVITYATGNSSIATVDTNGLVTAVAPGATTITVTSETVSTPDTTTVPDQFAAYGVATHPVGWWKGDALALAQGAPVTSWPDSSGNNHPLTPGTATPTFSATSFPAGAVTSVHATNAYMLNAAFSALSLAAECTVFLVYKASQTAGDQLPLSVGAQGPGIERNGSLLNEIGGAIYGATSGLDTAKHIHELVFAGSLVGNAARLNVLYEGVAQSLIFTGTIPATLPASGSVFVGGGGTNYGTFDGDIAELLIYNVALNSADRSTIRVALGAKDSITVTP